jgi:hypothetical protein
MKTIIKLATIIALFAVSAFAQDKQQFAFAAAKQSFEKEGKIETIDSDTAAAARIAAGKSDANTEQTTSVQCSVAGGVCSTRCTTSCTIKCNRW